MEFVHSWLAAVFDAGGCSEPPPEPQIPADYLHRPSKRQQQQQHLPPLHIPPLCSSTPPTTPPPACTSPVSNFRPSPKRSALAVIDSPNNSPPSKRLRGLNITSPIGAMTPVPGSPTKRASSRLASIKENDTTKQPKSEHDSFVTDSTSMSGRGRANSARGLHVNKPSWTPLPSASQSADTCAEEIPKQTPSAPSVSELGSKARSRSPVKRIADLGDAKRNVRRRTAMCPEDVPEDVRELYMEIENLIDRPRGIVPQGIKDKFQSVVRCNDEALEMYIATIPSDMSRDDLVIQFAALQRIQAESVWSDSKGVAESYWNSRVHDRMLEQAFDFSPGFKVHDIKSARILTELESLNPYGQTLKNRMVDYGITVGAPTISEKEVRACLRNSTGPPCDTVNPIDYEAARHEPFPIIIETKSDQGSEKEAVVQVSGWAIAYFDRLKTLSRGPVDITLPLIVIMGTSWKLFFACNLDDEIHIIKATHIGDTDKLVGCYKILKILKLLAEWVQTTFVNWYRDNVLPAH